MALKAEVTGTTLSVELIELAESLDAKGRATLARYLAADDKLFQAVVEALVSGGHYFEDDDEMWWFSSARMAELQEKLLPLMPDVAVSLIRELISQRDNAKLREGRLERWAWRLYREWPQERWRDRPDMDEERSWAQPPSEEEVRAALKARGIFTDPNEEPASDE